MTVQPADDTKMPDVASTYEARLDDVRAAPADEGIVELIVRRPAEGERELLDEAPVDEDLGLVGDRWATRDVARTPAYLSAQLTLISTRVLAIIEPDEERWALAGDQLYVDFDLSEANLPAGSRLAVGTAILEVSETPHTGCAKFSARFGTEALKFVNKSPGRELRLRGVNTRVVTPGTVRAGDAISKL